MSNCIYILLMHKPVSYKNTNPKSDIRFIRALAAPSRIVKNQSETYI